MRVLAERKRRCRVTKIVLYALEILPSVQHTDSEGVAPVSKSVLLDLAFLQNPFEVLINGLWT